MGKAGKIAKNGAVGKVNNTSQPVKAKKVVEKISALKNSPKKSCGPKITPKNLDKESDDDDEENEEDSGAEISKTENDDSENVDSDSKDQEEEQDENNDDLNDKNDDNSEDENDSDDDAPEEKAIDKQESLPKQKKKGIIDNEQNRDRRVYVNRLGPNTTDVHVKEHFSKFGEIESVKVSKGQRSKQDAVIVFKDASSCEKALKLHNTILNDSTILVEHAESPRPKSDEQRSIIILNSDNLTKLEGSVITEIFSECGEIDHFNVVCEKNVLAYITFKETSAVPKALELSGTTKNEIKVEVCPYKSKNKPQKTKIFVKNIANGVSEDDLTKMFEVCGAVVKVSLKRNNTNALATAIVEFENEDGYCKSFLMHEEKLRGRSLFIEPFSKKTGGQNNPNARGKRPAPKQWKGGPQKKFQKSD